MKFKIPTYDGYDHIHWAVVNGDYSKLIKDGIGTTTYLDNPAASIKNNGKYGLWGRDSDGYHYLLEGHMTKKQFIKKYGIS
jgi:hypothetical protein